MENRQNKPPKGGAASGHGGQKFHTDSEQAKLHKSKLRMESREERLNKARERLAKQKPPKKPGPIKRIARIAGHETHAFLHGKVYQEERDNVGVEGGHFVERSGEAALHYGRHKVRRAIREHPAKAAARAESRYIKATADYHSRKFAQEQPEAQSAAARLWHRHKLKREYQRKARETGDLSILENSETESGSPKGKVIDLIAPMIVMIFTAIATMIWTGYLNGGTNLVEDFANCSSSESLVFAGLVTVGFLLLFYLPRRVIGFKDFMNSVPEGGKLMMPPILILVLAWTLKGMTDALGIGDFVRQAVSLNEGLMRFVPLLIFCIAIFIAFSSGTSWGTFAILVPIVVNMFSETDPTMMIVAVSAVLAGAVCGDHISPISDTTIMSSSGAQSNHINHVQTQMQYAMVVVAACVPGYLIAGFTENWLITLVSSLAILTAALLYLRRRSLAEDARA